MNERNECPIDVPKNSRLDKYCEELKTISIPEDLERFMFKIFKECRDFLTKMGIEPYPCIKLNVIYKLEEYASLKRAYEERYHKQVSDMAFIDCLTRFTLGHDVIYINSQSYFGNKPIECSIGDLLISYFEELIHSSDPKKSETETVRLVFSVFRDFTGKELPEKT